MKPVALPYNLVVVDFSEIEGEILGSLRVLFDSYGINGGLSIPKKDYLNFFRYFTLKIVCSHYNELNNRKNTIFFVEEDNTSTEVLNSITEISKILPIPIFITKDRYNTLLDNNTAEYKDLTIRIKEYRYSIDFSKYSFNKINRFYKKHGLDRLLTDVKIA
jgi:hypothetical protein